ncbi:MAG: hypothetical protein WCJ56_04440 [bacterium]
MWVITRYEKYVLFPMDVTAFVLAVYFFFKMHWWLGIYFLVVWLFTSIIGQSLHPDMTGSQLAQGEQYRRAIGTMGEYLSLDDSYILGKAVKKTCLLITITMTLLGLHSGRSWWLAIIIGIASSLLHLVVFFAVIALQYRLNRIK